MLCFARHHCEWVPVILSLCIFLQWRRGGFQIRPEVTAVLTFIASPSLSLYCYKSRNNGYLWRRRSRDGGGHREASQGGCLQGCSAELLQPGRFCVIFHICILLWNKHIITKLKKKKRKSLATVVQSLWVPMWCWVQVFGLPSLVLFLLKSMLGFLLGGVSTSLPCSVLTCPSPGL